MRRKVAQSLEYICVYIVNACDALAMCRPSPVKKGKKESRKERYPRNQKDTCTVKPSMQALE
jgi:hypothetical protein